PPGRPPIRRSTARVRSPPAPRWSSRARRSRRSIAPRATGTRVRATGPRRWRHAVLEASPGGRPVGARAAHPITQEVARRSSAVAPGRSLSHLALVDRPRRLELALAGVLDGLTQNPGQLLRRVETHRHVAMITLQSGVVLRVHDVAVDARARVGGEIRKALG